MAPGRLYTNVTLPYSTDFNSSTIGSKQCVLDEHKIRDPVSGYGTTVEWSTDLIRSEAQKAGITNITYTEIQTLSIMMGIYTRRRLIIHGD